MKTVQLLRYLELFFLASIIILPIIIYTTPLSIHFVHPRVNFKEGDIIQITISDYSFDYNLTDLGNYNVTAGIYLGTYLDLSDFEEGKTSITTEEIFALSRNILLFEGNSTSILQYNFQIDKLGEKKYSANASIIENSKSFIISQIFRSELAPFFEPSICIGLTFTEEKEDTILSYIHWRKVFIFSTTKSRDILNWYSKHSYGTMFDFARYDIDTFNAIDYSQKYFSATTYKLRESSNLLESVTTNFEGYEALYIAQYHLNSNITQGSDIPLTCYWNYNFKLELQYFRGGEVY